MRPRQTPRQASGDPGRPTGRPARPGGGLGRRLAVLAILAAAAAPAALPAAAPRQQPAPGGGAAAPVIRILPPLPAKRQGHVRIEALLTDPQVHNVLFLLDGELAARRRSPPWAATLELAAPPREQRLRVEARDADDRLMGADELLLNRQARRLAVALRSIEPHTGGLLVRAELSLPREVRLERLELFLNESLQRTLRASDLAAGALDGARFADGQLEVVLEAGEPAPQDFVRLVAHFEDGRAVEDAGLAAGRRFAEEVDVRLVQLQVVVTNRRGLPMRGLRKENFRILEGGRERQPTGLFAADDVSLLLGLVIDSSGSMERVWRETRQAAAIFLDETLRDRDRGFLVDFDTRLRLLHPPTGERQALRAALAGLEPRGGTALYDSILFSLLQFDRQQGRRGLVVISDGYDADSQANPERTIEVGRRLGVPVYILALEGRRPGRPRRGISTGIADPAAAVQTLRLLTEPTGGRLYRVGSPQQVSRAFTLINAELRNQYVLTYYTDAPPEPGSPPEVAIEAPGHDGLRAKVVFGADHVY